MARFERQVNMLMFYIWLALIIETQVRFGCAWAFFVQAYTCLEFFYAVSCRKSKPIFMFLCMGEEENDTV